MVSKKPRKQCAKCPWKVSTNPHDIPNGYCETQHAALSSTVATPGDLRGLGAPVHMMACHETEVGKELPCVGWLDHQLGAGNNLGLRLAVIQGRIDGNVEVEGEQHPTLEDTLP